MKADDLFGVVVRTIGVVLLVMAFNELIEHLLNVAFSKNYTTVWVLLRRTSPHLVFGILFTFFADRVVRATYRKTS